MLIKKQVYVITLITEHKFLLCRKTVNIKQLFNVASDVNAWELM